MATEEASTDEEAAVLMGATTEELELDRGAYSMAAAAVEVWLKLP